MVNDPHPSIVQARCADEGRLTQLSPSLLVRLAAITLAFLLALLPAAIAAHGGIRALRITEGPYRIDAVVSRAGDQIDETITLLDSQTGRPIVNAVVALTLEGDDGRRVGPFIVRSTNGSYEVRYPPPEDGERWSVLIDIQGPQGPVTVQHPYREPDDGWGGRRALFINLLLIAAIVAIVIFLPRLRRRRS